MAFLSLFTISVAGYGQEVNTDKKLTVEVGADLVSTYVWRGMYQTGASIQPALSLSAYCVTIGAWGSTDFSTYAKEVDFLLSYRVKGFSAGIAGYWWRGEHAPYFTECGSHHLEASLGYTFPEKIPLTLEANMILTGDEDKNEKGKKFYSTYISAGFPFSIKNTEWEAGIGISPWKGMYGNHFNVVAINAKVTKNLSLSTEYTLPVFVELIFSPAQNNAFLVFGIRL